MDQPNQPTANPLFELSINQESRYHLFETGRWAKFIAIVGFIFIGLMIVYGIFIGTIMEDRISRFGPYNREFGPPFPTATLKIMMILYTVIFGLIYFFPCYYTLRFSNQIKIALTINDQLKLTEAFRNLKRTTRYLGILTIIFLVLMVIAVIMMITIFNSMPDFPSPQ